MAVNIDTKGLLEVLNIPKRKIFIFCLILMLISGVILFLPDEFLKRIFLFQLKYNIGTILGIIFIISSCIEVILILVAIFDFFKNKYIQQAVLNRIRKFLINNKNEAINLIVKELYQVKDHTKTLPNENGAVAELRSRGIISLTSSSPVAYVGENNCLMVKYVLQPFVVNIIDKDENLIKKYNK